MILQKQINKLLVIAPAWVGDMIMAQTLFKALKAEQPLLEIDVLAPAWTLPLTERMPQVNRGLLFPFKHGQLTLLQRYLFAKKLRAYRYEQAIILPSSYKSALTAYWAKIPLRTGWLGERRYGLINDVRPREQAKSSLLIQQYLSLGVQLDKKTTLNHLYPCLSINKLNQQALLAKLQLTTAKRIVALCPGAEYGPAKRWPITHLITLAKRLLAEGLQVWLFGSNKEKDIANELMTATSDQCVDLIGKTSLIEALDLLAVVDAVVCNDSGLMHMAAALNRPLVALYGSSTPTFTPPLCENVKIIHLGLTCSPCFKRDCPLTHFDCMTKITPELVFNSLTHLLTYEKNPHC